MPFTAKDYLLRFDLKEFENELAEASRAYTDFGTTVRSVLGSVAEDAAILQQKAAGAAASLASTTPQVQQAFRDTRKQFVDTGVSLKDMSTYGDKVLKDMKSLSGSDMKKVLSGDPTGMREELQMSEEQADYALSVSQVADALVRASKKQQEENKNLFRKAVDAIKKIPENEWANLRGAASGLLSNIPGNIFGHGLLGGLFNAIIFGYKENTRLDAQRGQLANVIEASGEQLWGKPAQKAINFFSEFQERAKNLYGISLQESQGVLKTLIDTGYKSDDLMRRYGVDVQEAGDNLALMSVALDKHFNQATGTSIKNITTIVTELGDSLSVATHKYADIAMAAQGTGMGVEKFVNATMAGASAMQQYGVDVKDVANTMINIKRHYESMGLSDKFSGAQAAKMVGEIGETLGGLSDGYIAGWINRIYPGMDALAAVQKWKEGSARAAEGGDREHFLQRSIVAMGDDALEKARGNRVQAIQILQGQTGMSNQQATVIIDAHETLKRTNDITKEGHKKLEDVKNAFVTEKEKIDQLKQTEWKLDMSIKDVGQGLLKILVGILGVLANGFRTVVDVVGAAWNALTGHPVEAAEILWGTIYRQEKLLDHVSSGLGDVVRGILGFADAMGGQFKKDAQPILDALGDQASPKGTGALGGDPAAASADAAVGGLLPAPVRKAMGIPSTPARANPPAPASGASPPPAPRAPDVKVNVVPKAGKGATKPPPSGSRGRGRRGTLGKDQIGAAQKMGREAQHS